MVYPIALTVLLGAGFNPASIPLQATATIVVQEQTETGDEIVKLQNQRLALLEKRVAAIQQRIDEGRASSVERFEAEMDLIRARIEIVERDETTVVDLISPVSD